MYLKSFKSGKNVEVIFYNSYYALPTIRLHCNHDGYGKCAAGCCDGIAEGICGKIRLACKGIYRPGISAFGGISPAYRIAPEKDSPVIVWDFHSLPVMVQMCFSFMHTDKDRFNVYKSRKKKKGNKRDACENRNVNIITDADGKKLVLINDIRFKGKRLQARRKAADVMIELIHSARCAGITSSFFSAFPNICRRLWNGKK